MQKTIYFDHNATTRPAPEVRESVLEWLENWGNPSSIHQMGRGPKALMRWSRLEIAKAIGADALELIFTSGGSESNNLALKGVFEKQRPLGRTHFLISEVEHPSVIKAAKFLESIGAEVQWIPVGRNGTLDLEIYKKLLRPTTALVSCQLANNETGSVFPIQEMARLAHQVGALMHTDAVQALGKMAFDVKDLGVDLLSLSGHKFYALKGAGVLYSKRGTLLEPLIHGGGQERSRRAGTENLLAIASLATMCARLKDLPVRVQNMTQMRNLLESRVLSEIHDVRLTASESPRLPNTSSLILAGVDGETMLMNLDMLGFCVSTGAACSSGSQEPSPVLRAMGLSREEAQNSLRVSLGWETTEEEIHLFVEALKAVVLRVRNIQNQMHHGVPMEAK